MSHYGQQLRGRDADEGHGTYPPAAGRGGSGRGTFCGYFGGTARHALCLCCPLVADRLRPAADGAVCGASGAAQAGFSAGLDGGVPALRSFAAGRRRGRPQRIRSNAFELWRAAGSGRRACSCTAGRTGPAKRHIVFRVGNGFPHRIAPAPVRIRAGCAAGRGVFQLFRRTGADIMPDRHDGAADGALSARLYRRYLHRHGMAGA